MNEPPQKQLGADDFSRIPNGAPGIETRLMLIWEGVRAAPHRHSPVRRARGDQPGEDVRPLAAQGRHRGRAPTQTWWCGIPSKQVTLSVETHHMRVDYNPYEGRVVTGAPAMVLSRGEVIVDHGEFKGRAGRGEFVKRVAGPPSV